MSTLAQPPTADSGALRSATAGTMAASPCSSPSHWMSGASVRNRSAARRTLSTLGPPALPLVL